MASGPAAWLGQRKKRESGVAALSYPRRNTPTVFSLEMSCLQCAVNSDYKAPWLPLAVPQKMAFVVGCLYFLTAGLANGGGLSRLPGEHGICKLIRG